MSQKSQTVWKEKFEVKWSILGLIVVSLTTALLLVGIIDSISRGDVDSTLIFLIPVTMTTIGFSFGNAVSGGFRIDKKFTAEKSVKVLFYMAISSGAFLMINVTKNLATTYGFISDSFALPGLAVVTLAIVSRPLFSVVMAVSEELFFRYYLTKLFSNIGNNAIAMVAVGFTIFPAYHAWRYGPYLPLLLVTAFCGMVLCYTYIKSGMPSAVILPHAIVNFIGFVSTETLLMFTVLIFFVLILFSGKKRKKK